MNGSQPMGFTCITCRVTFIDPSLQREHYKNEWHRYNLKRKVAQLVPLTAEDFQKVEEQQKIQEKLNDETAAKASARFYCDSCHKQFANEKAWDQHNQSRKHADVVAKKAILDLLPKSEVYLKAAAETEEPLVEDIVEEEDSDWESIEGEGEPIPVTGCLFCPQESPSVDGNVEHMTSAHSFFIPDLDYLVDVEGLLKYLGEKVGMGLRCLWCCDSGRGFHSVRATQQHMIDKGHCKMRHEAGETLLEYVDFYDYSASYPDAHVAGDAEEEVDVKELEIDEELQLILPSGAVIGHRSLAKYFKQNLRPVPLESKSKRRAILDKVINQHRALGWTGSSGPAALQKSRDFKFMKKIIDKKWLKLGITNNMVKVKHFRDQTGLF